MGYQKKGGAEMKKGFGVILVLLLAISFLAACGTGIKLAEFTLSSVIVSPSTATVNDTVTISATVTNVGEVSGSCKVILTIDGYSDSKTIVLANGGSTTVSFSYAATTEGNYTVALSTPDDSKSVSFAVSANVTWVTPSEDELLGQYENSDLLFKKTVREEWIVYSHWRKIDNVTVELDRRVYIFDRETEELIEKEIHWRDDLPDHLPPIISEEEAIDIVGANNTTMYLAFVESILGAYNITTPTNNPCWVVRVWEDYYDSESNTTYTWNVDVVVVDAVTGEIVGHGTPVP
jgi:hypothetical protein